MDTMEEIDLLQIREGIKKRLRAIIGITIFAGALSFLISSYLITPKYQSGTVMIVADDKSEDGATANYNDILTNQKLVSTYAEILKTRGISEEVIKNLQLNMSVSQLNSELVVSSVKDTELISIKVTDSNPLRAMDIANETSEIFKKKISEIMNYNNVKIIDQAIESRSPISPNIKKNTITGAVIGLVIGFAYAIFAELTDNTVKSTEDIVNYGVTFLGFIPLNKELQK